MSGNRWGKNKEQPQEIDHDRESGLSTGENLLVQLGLKGTYKELAAAMEIPEAIVWEKHEHLTNWIADKIEPYCRVAGYTSAIKRINEAWVEVAMGLFDAGYLCGQQDVQPDDIVAFRKEREERTKQPPPSLLELIKKMQGTDGIEVINLGSIEDLARYLGMRR